MTNNPELININSRIDTLFEKLEQIDCKLEKLLGIMNYEIKGNCDKMGNVQMCFSSIPFFKEIIIMAFVCDYCGYRNSEIK